MMHASRSTKRGEDQNIKVIFPQVHHDKTGVSPAILNLKCPPEATKVLWQHSELKQ